MEVDVDAATVPAGNGEDPVELTLGVTVNAHGIESADHLRAIAHRLFQQVQGAGPCHHAGLRKGHHVNVYPVAMLVARRLDAMQMRQADVGPDIDMGAHMGSAASDQPPE